MQKKGVIIVLVIIILLGIIYYLGFTKQGEEVMDRLIGEEDIKETANPQQIPSFPQEPLSPPIEEMPAQIVEGKIAIIEINDTKFNPDEINITVGMTVNWINIDPRRTYQIYERAANQKFNSFRIGLGENYSYMFDEAGTYYFSDAIFAFMKGTIRVTNE